MRRLTLALAFPALLLPATAMARPDRRGAQAEVLVGSTGCMSTASKCTAEGDVAGKTGPLVGFGGTLGIRPLRVLMVGAAYNLGFFNPDYRQGGADIYRRAYQHSLFGVLRAILPIWRFDFGLELGAGWSRQVFATGGALSRDLGDLGVVRVDREYSQGFALKTAPSVDFYLTRRFFLGAKVDFIFNFHGRVCYDVSGGQQRTCFRARESNQAAVHQVIAGLHLGMTF